MDDSYWGFSSLLSDIITEHAPVKTNILKRTPVPYMNSNLRKTINAKTCAGENIRKTFLPKIGIDIELTEII